MLNHWELKYVWNDRRKRAIIYGANRYDCSLATIVPEYVLATLGIEWDALSKDYYLDDNVDNLTISNLEIIYQRNCLLY